MEVIVISLEKLESWEVERLKLSEHFKVIAANKASLEILEAGCGTRWFIELNGIEYILTGLDADEGALEARKSILNDLDVAILGDLRTAELPEEKYDIIFSSNVLEHIKGAREVLDNFVRWTKPGGFIILLIPNGDSAKGFLTKITPHWFHVVYIRYFQGRKTAGQPGYGPFPTFFDPEVSLRGIRAYCDVNPLAIRAEYSIGHGRIGNWIKKIISGTITWGLHLVSFGKLTAQHPDLIFVIEKLED